jgi:hypothetical protein
MSLSFRERTRGRRLAHRHLRVGRERVEDAEDDAGQLFAGDVGGMVLDEVGCGQSPGPGRIRDPILDRYLGVSGGTSTGQERPRSTQALRVGLCDFMQSNAARSSSLDEVDERVSVCEGRGDAPYVPKLVERLPFLVQDLLSKLSDGGR